MLASRLLSRSSKSSTTKIVRELGSGYGQSSPMDVLYQFMENKMPPLTSAIVSMLKGRDFKGDKPTLLSGVQRTTVPISISNAIQLKDDNSASAIAGVIADTLGVNANTYGYSEDWNQNTSKYMTAFKNKVSKKTFAEANKEYKKLVSEWLKKTIYTKKYKDMTEDDKRKYVKRQKSQFKKQVLAKYGRR